MKDALLYFDGLCEPTNPGGFGCYGFAILVGGETVKTGNGCVGLRPTMTNNIAEYAALIYGIEAARDFGVRRIGIFGDSKLVVEQVSGNWRINAAHLKIAVEKALTVLDGFETWSITWIARELNREADALSRDAYRARTGSEVIETSGRRRGKSRG